MMPRVIANHLVDVAVHGTHGKRTAVLSYNVRGVGLSTGYQPWHGLGISMEAEDFAEVERWGLQSLNPKELVRFASLPTPHTNIIDGRVLAFTGLLMGHDSCPQRPAASISPTHLHPRRFTNSVPLLDRLLHRLEVISQWLASSPRRIPFSNLGRRG